MLARHTTTEAIAEATGLPPALIRRFVELGLIVPQSYYSEADLRELRCTYRLIEDLGIDVEAVEVVLRMCRRIVALQREVGQLQAELLGRRLGGPAMTWVDGLEDALVTATVAARDVHRSEREGTR